MKKVAVLEVWVDETISDAKECVNEVYSNMLAHEYIDDGSVKIKILEMNESLENNA